jgi:hypothetical protein
MACVALLRGVGSSWLKNVNDGWSAMGSYGSDGLVVFFFLF